MGATTRHPFINYARRAFRLPGNLLFLGTMGAATALSALAAATVLPLGIDVPSLVPVSLGALTIGIEGLALYAISRMPRFVAAVNASQYARIADLDHRHECLRQAAKLRKPAFDRFLRFYGLKDQTITLLRERTLSQALYDQGFFDHLNHLELRFVELLATHQSLTDHHQQDGLAHWDAEITKLTLELDRTPKHLQSLLQQRLQLAVKRRERAVRLQDQYQAAELQLDTFEHTLAYLHEQALMSRADTQELIQTLDHLVADADQRHELWTELNQTLQAT